MKFIYVFQEADRDALIARGFHLLKEDLQQGVFVFENRSEIRFSDDEFTYVLTDQLTF